MCDIVKLGKKGAIGKVAQELTKLREEVKTAAIDATKSLIEAREAKRNRTQFDWLNQPSKLEQRAIDEEKANEAAKKLNTSK